MKIELHNIAKVREADIKLNGLTVIAGVNGSGKSTVGKMLFSVVQALKSSQKDFLLKSDNLLDKHIEALYTRLGSQSLKFAIDRNGLPPRHQLKRQLLNGEQNVVQLQETINNFLDQHETITPRTKALIEKDLNNIRLVIENRDNRAAVQASSIQNLIESEFINAVCSIGTQASEVKFEASEFDNALLSFSLSNNSIQRVECSDNYESIEDATYVESPLYLHLIDTLNYTMQYVEVDRTQPFIRTGMIPTHIKDFVVKIAQARLVAKERPSDRQTIMDNIQGVTGGAFQFDKKTSRLYFGANGKEYSPINTASGIKTFGVLQLLLQSEAISPNRILIWGEPENHLHPEWQIQFADVILQLVEAGIPIVISTHSPYFLQAIRFYAAHHGVEKFVNYYLAEEVGDGLSDINEVTDELNQVFVKLSEPLQKILNIPNPKREER